MSNTISLHKAVLLLPLLTMAWQVMAQQPAPVQQTLKITVHDAAQQPIKQALAEVKAGDKVLASATTDDKGVASLSLATASACMLTISKSGFVPENYAFEAGATLPESLDFILASAALSQQSIDVKGTPDNPVVESSGAAGTKQLSTTAAKESAGKPPTLKDALPLVPGIVRGSDGSVRIAGYGENHSALLVNGVDVTDPATGNFGLSIPIDSVDTIAVAEMPYLAQYGRFTAGVVTAETRRGGDKWSYSLNDPLPEFRIRSWHLEGLKTATPRLNLSGPLIKNRLYFLEGLEYTLNKHSVMTLPYPYNQTTSESVNSFSQVDAILSSTQTLSASFHIAPHRVTHAGLDYFNPIPVTPSTDTHEYTGTLIHRMTIDGGVLSSTVASTHDNTSTDPLGMGSMILQPQMNSGNYFSTATRRASRFEWMESWTSKPWHLLAGTHTSQIGTLLTHSEDSGSFTANPVLIENAAGNLLRRIDFSNGQSYSLHDTSPAGYMQDHWAVLSNFATDIGIRFESQTITHTTRFAPRAGFIWTPDKEQKVRVRGGAGVFFDSVPLDMYAFEYYPQQTITSYDGKGNVVGVPVTYLNLTSETAKNASPFVGRSAVNGNFAPYSIAWNVEVERVFNDTLTMRAKYLQSESNSVLRLDQSTVGGYAAFVLNSNGSAHTRQMELTAQIGASAQRRLYVSYVYQHARGLVNDATDYLGDISYPVIRSNFHGSMPSEIPHRFLAWGTYNLPHKFRVMPKFEYRTGFPYLVTDETQSLLASGAQKRFPHYLSADVRISKDIQISRKHAIRLSTTIQNITNHFNALEVHSNTGDPEYGQFFGNYNRKYTIDFDFLF